MRLLVLHAFWSLDHGLGLWAEDSEKTVKTPSQALKAARPHPFAASADVVAAIQAGDVGGTTLLLPSLRRSPLDSPDLVRVVPRPLSSTGPSLLPWTVPVVWVQPAALTAIAHPPFGDAAVGDAAFGAEHGGAELASALFPEDFPDNEPTPLSAVRIAPSARFLGELARFAAELAERGRVLPEVAWASDVIDESAVAEARWRAVLRGPDALAFGDLITATPPAFRAEPGSEDAGGLIAVALDTLTDAAVRRRLPGDLPTLPPSRGRKPLQPRAVEAWLEALRTPDARIRVPEPALAELEQSLAPWVEYAREAAAPARATFRLSEAPSAEYVGDEGLPWADDSDDSDGAAAAGAALDTPSWRLEFLLQSSADPKSDGSRRTGLAGRRGAGPLARAPAGSAAR